MLIAKCDRCGAEIPDYNEEKMRLVIVNGWGHEVERFDLCETCGPQVNDTLSDFIKGA